MEHDAEKLRIGCEIAMRKYKVYSNITDEFLFEGTAEECAAFCGLSVSWFKEVANDIGVCCRGRYRVMEVYGTGDAQQEKQVSSDSSMSAAARRWDEFVTPIREYYGIPVYRAGKEVKR